jgi:N-ethylmaleimide reductase
MIVSEATMVDEFATGYPNTPGIYTANQVEGWRPICQQVQNQGTLFFSQLWHTGAMSHACYRGGRLPISASDIPPIRQSGP